MKTSTNSRTCYLYEVVYSKLEHRTLKMMGKFKTSKEAEAFAEEKLGDSKAKYIIEFVKEEVK